VLGAVIALVAALLVPSGSGYANEKYSPPTPDLSPPAVPTVTSADHAGQVTKDNAIYAETITAPTRCVLPTVDLATAPEPEIETYLNDVVGCLMAVWIDPVTKAGFQLPRPPVTVYSTPITTGCGKLGTNNAYYCMADQRIYYATDIVDDIPADVLKGRLVVETIIAHELGHAVQARTGILPAGDYLQYVSTSVDEYNELSRRTELQADCFSGLFIRSVAASVGITQRDLALIAESARVIGDDAGATSRTHGRGSNRQYWTQLGMASTSIRVCNTFVVSSDEVG